MLTDSKYTKILHSNNLTYLKYNELRTFAMSICEHKNIVSEYVNKNLLKYLDYNYFSIFKKIKNKKKSNISNLIV